MIKDARSAIYLGIAGNLALAVIKWLAGHFGNSYALIADAIESTADVFSSLLILAGIHYASRPPDANHPYGHGRIEPLITFFIVFSLAGSAVLIAHESIQKIRTPHAPPAGWTLYVLSGVIIIKEIFYRVTRKNAVQAGSTVLKADAFHHRSDAITSLMAFLGIVIALIGGPGYEIADDVAALCASAIILYSSYRLLRPALGELMDEHLYEPLVERIRTLAQQVPGVLGTEKCHIRKAGAGYFVDLHALVNGNISVQEGHTLAHRLKKKLLEEMPELLNVLIHVEPAAQ